MFSMNISIYSFLRRLRNNLSPFIYTIHIRMCIVFHYALCIICAIYLICIAVLKFNYYYWYSQPLTFRFSVWRLWAARRANTFTSVMNPLDRTSYVTRRLPGVTVYPFITNVNYKNVDVYSTNAFNTGLGLCHSDIPFDMISELLNKDHKNTVNNGAYSTTTATTLRPYIHNERLMCILANETHGLSAFVGIYRSRPRPSPSGDIHGVCILTPRIKIERVRSDGSSTSPSTSTSIYVCEHLAWSRYNVSGRESLELLETTEYIQKSREIAGEQTLYRYNEIPWFVIPFTTIYTYSISLERLLSPGPERGPAPRPTPGRRSVIKVSSVNFAIFYAFINECSRDFTCSILNEITHLQHLIQSGIYQIYMLLLNNTRVLSTYIYGPSWVRMNPDVVPDKRPPHLKKKTRANRIDKLHDHISKTSTAVVKYLPPVIEPKYDLSGKRVRVRDRDRDRDRDRAEGRSVRDTDVLYNPSTEIPRLLSSIRNKQICDTQVFIDGFIDSLKLRCRDAGLTSGALLIDTIAHNYIIIDEIIRGDTWSHKWYYVLYNAIIHRELPCKDLFMV